MSKTSKKNCVITAYGRKEVSDKETFKEPASGRLSAGLC